jgi:butyryl-CoA dehydrogenase
MNEYLSQENLNFILFEVLNCSGLTQAEYFKDYNEESLKLLLNSIKDFADRDLFPSFRGMDNQPAYFENGKIVIHPAFGNIMKKIAALGLMGSTFKSEDGGLQLPSTIYTAAYFIMGAANNNVPGYSGLTSGAANLINTFGSLTLKEKFVSNMLSGKWAGTMCMTEPQAGSSLSDIATLATPADEGSYKIKGQKIFISGGDHQFCENFIHLTLARIEGAPAGTRGISLFVVPKFREENNEVADNDVIVAGESLKLGQKGYCTTHLIFGDNNNCRGWLVGEPNMGLPYMFKMMNEARIAVGRDATAVTTAAYYASLNYAKERPQGRRITNVGKKDLSKGQTLIINHADVRRMLLFQKSIAEGSLSLVLQSAYYNDLITFSEGTEKEKYHLLLELLTPITKTFPAERGRVSVSEGLQVLGGYGFTTDFSLQQYYRDIRIMSLYEGSTGIQSLDLLGRKVPMNNGQALKILAEEINHTIKLSQKHESLKHAAFTLGENLVLAKNVTEYLLDFVSQGDHERFLSDATVFMDFMGTIVVGWQWLKMGLTASDALLSGNKIQTVDFYESTIHTMKFYFKYEMTRSIGLAKTLLDPEVLTVKRDREVI